MDAFDDIRAKLKVFAKARDWEKFHSPKNLSMALAVEAAELMEHFQWLTEQESIEVSGDKLQQITDEIADIQVYLLLIADKLRINLNRAVIEKMAKNEKKYPAE